MNEVSMRSGFHIDRPFQVVVTGLKYLEIVGAIHIGGAVKRHAALAKVLRNRWMFWRAFEPQVFKQMRPAGFAVVLEARTDQIGHVDGHRGFRRIRK